MSTPSSTPSLHDRRSAGLVGRTGTVVTRIRDDRPGEVRLVHRGLPQTVLASAERPLAVGTHVLVVLEHAGSHVDVVAWDAAPAGGAR